MSVLTADPPWDRGEEWQYAAVRDVALRVLRPGGCLLLWYAQLTLPAVVDALRGLEFVWLLSTIYDSPRPIYSCGGILSRNRPVLLYAKPGDDGKRPHTLSAVGRIHDVLHVKTADKEWHPWAQNEATAGHWIEKLTNPGETVADCHVGGGTVAAAVAKLPARNYVGTDTDESAINIAKARLAGG